MATIEFLALCFVAWVIGHNMPLPDSDGDKSIGLVDWLIILFVVGALAVFLLKG